MIVNSVNVSDFLCGYFPFRCRSLSLYVLQRLNNRYQFLYQLVIHSSAERRDKNILLLLVSYLNRLAIIYVSVITRTKRVQVHMCNCWCAKSERDIHKSTDLFSLYKWTFFCVRTFSSIWNYETKRFYYLEFINLYECTVKFQFLNDSLS